MTDTTKAMSLQELEKQMLEDFKKQSLQYRDPDCFLIGCGYGSAKSCELHEQRALSSYKAELREFLEQVAEWDKDYSSTMHRIMAKQLLKSLELIGK